jgi:hypothetical protein
MTHSGSAQPSSRSRSRATAGMGAGEVASPEFKLAVQNALEVGSSHHPLAGEILDLFLASGYDLLCPRDVMRSLSSVSAIAAASVARGPPSLQVRHFCLFVCLSVCLLVCLFVFVDWFSCCLILVWLFLCLFVSIHVTTACRHHLNTTSTCPVISATTTTLLIGRRCRTPPPSTWHNHLHHFYSHHDHHANTTATAITATNTDAPFAGDVPIAHPRHTGCRERRFG